MMNITFPIDEEQPTPPPLGGLERAQSDGQHRPYGRRRGSTRSLLSYDERFGTMRRPSSCRTDSFRRFSLIIDDTLEETTDPAMRDRLMERTMSARSMRSNRSSAARRRRSTVYDDVGLANVAALRALVEEEDKEDGSVQSAGPGRRSSVTATVRKPGCMKRHPILIVILFALTGIGIGIGLSTWQPEDEETKDIVLKWVGLVGNLFINALKALVLPLVFINVILAIADLASQGYERNITRNALLLFAVTSFMSTIAGAVSILSFRPLFNELQETTDASNAFIELGCNGNNTFLTQLPNGTVLCADEPQLSENNATIFSIEGFSHPRLGETEEEPNMSDTIYEGLFTKLVISNVTAAFYEGNYAGVVIMALCFGIALSKVLRMQDTEQEESVVVIFLREVNSVILVLTRWVVLVTPYGVLSLIAQVVGSQDHLLATLEDVGFVVVALILGCMLHFVAAYIFLYAIITKSNPLSYLRHLIPSISTAFATASSAVALPSNMECVQNSGMVPDYIRNLVLPLGLSMNMDGVGVYISCLTLWLAFVNNIDPSVGQIVLIIAFACIGTIGCPPVPFGALIIIYNTYIAVFGGVPTGYEYLLAVDWLMGRFGTVLNSTGDAIVAGMVAKLVSSREQQEQKEQEEEEEEQQQRCSEVPGSYLDAFTDDLTFDQEMSDETWTA